MSADVGTELGGRYVLAQRIGSGGAGEVWSAHDRVLGRDVAIKLLHPELARDEEAVARFRAEAIAAARLNHPNAVLVYDVGHDRDRDYLVMELAAGPTFAELLTAAPLPAGAAAHLGVQVGRALGTAHARGLVHRDVKPANVLLAGDGTAKVADFGIARALGESTARLTTPGMIVGTARYIAPEQLRDDPVDARADVFALGLLLHHALTGQPPYGEGSATEIAARRLTTELPTVRELRPDVPVALDDAVARATRRDPAERPADGTELALALAPAASPDAAAEVAATVRTLRAGSPPRPGGPVGAPASTAAPAPRSTPAAAAPAPTRTATGGVGADGAGPVTHEGSRVRGRGPGRRRRFLLLTLAAVAVAAAVSLSPWEPWPDAPEPLAIEDAGDHDPLGDEQEHPARIPDAFDDNGDTAWTTETYFAPLGDLKAGVGLWADLGAEHDVHAVELSLVTAGGAVEVWLGDAPPDPTVAPDDWGRQAGAASDLAATTTVDLERGSRGRVVVVWFTDLPQVSEGWRAEVTGVRVVGRA